MAQAKFYRKFSPQTAVVLSDGRKIQFSTLDNARGYFSTADEGVQSELLVFMQQSRYGLSEISYAEYDAEFLQKKRAGMQRPAQSREELSPSTLRQVFRDAGDSSGAAGLAVAEAPKVPVPAATVAEPTTPVAAQAPTNPEFKPPVGKRVKRTATIPTT
jgi:hypothetical protein